MLNLLNWNGEPDVGVWELLNSREEIMAEPFDEERHRGAALRFGLCGQCVI